MMIVGLNRFERQNLPVLLLNLISVVAIFVSFQTKRASCVCNLTDLAERNKLYMNDMVLKNGKGQSVSCAENGHYLKVYWFTNTAWREKEKTDIVKMIMVFNEMHIACSRGTIRLQSSEWDINRNYKFLRCDSDCSFPKVSISYIRNEKSIFGDVDRPGVLVCTERTYVLAQIADYDSQIPRTFDWITKTTCRRNKGPGTSTLLFYEINGVSLDYWSVRCIPPCNYTGILDNGLMSPNKTVDAYGTGEVRCAKGSKPVARNGSFVVLEEVGKPKSQESWETGIKWICLHPERITFKYIKNYKMIDDFYGCTHRCLYEWLDPGRQQMLKVPNEASSLTIGRTDWAECKKGLPHDADGNLIKTFKYKCRKSDVGFKLVFMSGMGRNFKELTEFSCQTPKTTTTDTIITSSTVADGQDPIVQDPETNAGVIHPRIPLTWKTMVVLIQEILQGHSH